MQLWWWFLIILLVVILSNISTRFNYIIKFAYMYLAYQVLSVPIILLTFPWPRHPGNALVAAKILRCVNWPISVKFTIEHEDRLRVPDAAVLLLNHQSGLDSMSLCEIWPILKTAVPIAKKELMYSGPFGLAMWLIGAVFIDRSSKSSRDDLNKVGEVAKAQGTKLIVFPEGTRNGAKNLSLLPFKKGAFHVAVNGTLPILPVVISQYEFLDYKNQRFSPGHVTIRVLPRIDTTGHSKDTIDQLVAEARDAMTEALRDMGLKEKTE